MTSKEQEIIKDLDKCDFREIHKYFVDKSEARKALSKEEKQVRDVSYDIWDWLMCFGTRLGYFGSCLSPCLWPSSVSMTITPLFIKFIGRCCTFHGFAGYQSSSDHGLGSCPVQRMVDFAKGRVTHRLVPPVYHVRFCEVDGDEPFVASGLGPCSPLPPAL